jgi:diacylglycerol kinase
MGAFKNAWATYKAAARKQKELAEVFAERGIKFLILDTEFQRLVVKEAINTSTEAACDKYAPLVWSVALRAGNTTGNSIVFFAKEWVGKT